MQKLFPSNNFVNPRVGRGLRLMVGEAPGEEESKAGEPFVGGAGRWLRGTLSNGRRVGGLIGSAGISDAEVSYINVIQCRPPDNDFPTDAKSRSYISKEDAEASVKHCVSTYVEPFLKYKPWNRVDLLGSKALKFVGGKSEGIGKWRGSILPIPSLGEKSIAVPTIHPAAIAREQAMIPAVKSDLKKSLVIPPEYYQLYPAIESVREFNYPVFALDIETPWYGDNYQGERKIIMVGLVAKEHRAIVVPFSGAYIPELKRILANAKEVIGHNLVQFDLPILEENGVKLSEDCKVWDTMLMQHLLQPDLPHDLEFLGSIFTNKPAWKHSKESFELYCARDTDVTFQAWLQLKPLLVQQKLERLYSLVSLPLGKICYLMHRTGFKVNPGKVVEIRATLQRLIREAEEDLPESMKTQSITVRRRQPAPEGTIGKSGKPLKFMLVDATEALVPWRSTQITAHYLYNELKLPSQYKEDKATGKESLTTDKIALEKLFHKTGDKSIKAILRLRKLDELDTTFAKERMTKVERMYPHFNVHGTSSGRLSSSGPNLQNVPEAIRMIYVPSHAGWKIVECDFSQIENRLTAFFSNDSERLERFLKDPDFSEHKWVASIFFDIPYKDVIKDNDKDAPYGKAKRINHGKGYGMGVRKISKDNDLDFKEVKDLVAKLNAAMPRTTDWQERTAAKAKREGLLTTPFGRKRWFYTSSVYTESLSFLPQSTAADIIFRAMVGLMYERIGWPLEKALEVVNIVEPLPLPARLLLQVHDSLVLESPPEKVEEVVATLKKVMEQPWRELGGFSIPISITVSDHWAGKEI
jgi:uracil-DNA glycosylase family 4